MDKVRENLIKELVKEEYSAKVIAEVLDIPYQMLNKYLKEVGLNRSSKESARIRNLRKNRGFEIDEFNKTKIGIKIKRFKRDGMLRKNEKPKNEITFRNIKGDYALYRFIDLDGRIIYVGKCERSIHSNGHGGIKEYSLKDRMIQHFVPSSKHLPKCVYESTYIIEYALCKTQEELLVKEDNLILKYKMLGQCVWNGQFKHEIDARYNVDDIKWTTYKIFTGKNIRKVV